MQRGRQSHKLTERTFSSKQAVTAQSKFFGTSLPFCDFYICYARAKEDYEGIRYCSLSHARARYTMLLEHAWPSVSADLCTLLFASGDLMSAFASLNLSSIRQRALLNTSLCAALSHNAWAARNSARSFTAEICSANYSASSQ